MKEIYLAHLNFAECTAWTLEELALQLANYFEYCKESTPEQYKESLRFTFYKGDEDEDSGLRAHYLRPFTWEEVENARVAKVLQQENRAEFELYTYLKEKFEKH